MENNKKNYILILIIIVLIISLIVIGIMILKNKESKSELKNESIIENKSEKEEEKNQFSLNYNGMIRCVYENKENKEYFIDSNIHYLEVENGIIQTREIKRKILFFNEEAYNAFKNNENLLNPIYDDDNLTVEYTTYEKEELDGIEVNSYTKDLNKMNYECEEIN